MQEPNLGCSFHSMMEIAGHPFQQNLPVTPVTDIKIHQNDLILSTMGRGFWIMDNISVLHKVEEASKAADALFV